MVTCRPAIRLFCGAVIVGILHTAMVLQGFAITNSTQAAPIRGRIVDAGTGAVIPARLYVRSSDGQWFFAQSTAPEGTAVQYDKRRGEQSVEIHTTLSAHPFVVEVPAGTYELTAVRGHEYHECTTTIQTGTEPVEVTLPLRRWIDMAGRGWFSGDTHVHRSLEDLPNILLAEDLNVALPLTQWVTSAYTPPARGDKNERGAIRNDLIRVDATHVIYPLNTEYEIFSVKGRRHTLGAVFVLNHREPFSIGVPPVRPVAEEARRQGAILDLDKHSWPWSLMLMPVMNVDLFELSNNHVWRTNFAFKSWTRETQPAYVPLEMDRDGFTEAGWIHFGLETYYTLLNCGFRMRPTAGTASGVHPVPLGFGRVYVHVEPPFEYTRWIRGLNAGQSFVTTRPMLNVEFNGHLPGHTFQVRGATADTCRIRGWASSPVPLDRIEVIVNAQRHTTLTPENTPTDTGAYRSAIDVAVPVEGTSWVAVRCFERPSADGRFRFAHSAPVFFDVPDRPLKPRRAEVDYLIGRMEEEIERNREVLDAESLAEYQRALEVYQRLRGDAAVPAPAKGR